MKKFFKDPLLHFLLIGAALFLLFELFDNPSGPQSDRILITQGQVDFLKANFSRTWQRSPGEKELQGLIDGFVREEIFYREALALGLDRDDSVIRRRMNQKLEMMSDDLAGVITPSDEELQQFLNTHPERFHIEPKVAFRHVFLNVDQRGNSVMTDAEKFLAELTAPENATDPDTLGDSLMLPRSFNLSTVSEISRLFGKPFSLELTKIKPGTWVGPIRSGYGFHLVLVTEQVDGRLPELNEVRDVVEREWLAANRKELKDNIYKKLRKKYTVVIEQPADEAKPIQPVTDAQAAPEKQK